MMKPTIKREASTGYVRLIFVPCALDRAIEFADFGNVREVTPNSLYIVEVDSRFNFDEVMAYIKSQTME